MAGACNSGGGDSGGGSEDTSEQTLAEAMLLTLADFPTGWAEEPDIKEESPFDECELKETGGRTGRAQTGDFSNNASASISQSLGVYKTPEDVSARLDQIKSGDWSDCLLEVIEDGGLDDDEVTFSSPSVSPISFPTIGDETVPIRLEIRYEQVGETGFGSEGSVFLDLISVRVDRVGFTITGNDVLSPYDAAELEAYARKAEARVRENLVAP
jgi:hypothetical protein